MWVLFFCIGEAAMVGEADKSDDIEMPNNASAQPTQGNGST